MSTSAAASASQRRQCDFTKLLMKGYEVDMNSGSNHDFFVTFHGPEDTLYEGAIYRVHVTLPEQYPYSSPGIGFEGGTVFHPNIDEKSGSVCLDVINQTWTPMYQLVNVFDVFLPQLLTYPNPADPLNSDAAALYMKDSDAYNAKVRDYVKRSVKMHEQRKKSKDTSNNNDTVSPALSKSPSGGDSSPLSKASAATTKDSLSSVSSVYHENSHSFDSNSAASPRTIASLDDADKASVGGSTMSDVNGGSYEGSVMETSSIEFVEYSGAGEDWGGVDGGEMSYEELDAEFE